MSSDKVKQLEQYFTRATNESVGQPDTQLFIEICNIINSRADMPKHAVGILKKRMMSTRNPKALYLCLEFLEVAANACELNFQSQVASKDFMSVLNALINREIDKTVLDKLTHLTKYWIQVYGSFKDILPGIFAFAEALEKKGVNLPSHVESPFAYLLKNKRASQPSKPDYEPEEKESYSRPSGGFSTQAKFTSEPRSTGGKGPNPKLKKDLDVVRQNIQLTNEMIDAQDPREDPKNNDVLTDLVQTLKGMENKLREFIQKQNDEDSLNYLLEINDDLNKTFDRYKAIRRGEKPRPFIPAGVQYSIEREDPNQQKSKPQPQKPKPSAQDDLLDLLGDTNLNQGQKSQANTTAMNKAEVQNLFDLDFSPSLPQSNTSTQGFNTAQPSFSNDLLSGGGQQAQTQNTQQQQNTQSNTTQNFASQISNLYKTANQPSTNTNQFATAPSTGGFGNNTGGFGGMQNQGFGGGFQTSTQGNTGMSNMNAGFNQGGFGQNQGGMNQNMGQNQGMSGGFGMGGYGNFNTANTGFGQNQGQFGAFNTANPSMMGYGGGFGGGMNAGGVGNMGGFGGQQQQQQQSNIGFNQQPMGGFNTVPTQNTNAFDMSGMKNSLPQQQTQTTSQSSPFDDLI